MAAVAARSAASLPGAMNQAKATLQELQYALDHTAQIGDYTAATFSRCMKAFSGPGSLPYLPDPSQISKQYLHNKKLWGPDKKNQQRRRYHAMPEVAALLSQHCARIAQLWDVHAKATGAQRPLSVHEQYVQREAEYASEREALRVDRTRANDRARHARKRAKQHAAEKQQLHTQDRQAARDVAAEVNAAVNAEADARAKAMFHKHMSKLQKKRERETGVLQAEQERQRGLKCNASKRARKAEASLQLERELAAKRLKRAEDAEHELAAAKAREDALKAQLAALQPAQQE